MGGPKTKTKIKTEPKARKHKAAAKNGKKSEKEGGIDRAIEVVKHAWKGAVRDAKHAIRAVR